jgi:predicted Zn-dependent protease
VFAFERLKRVSTYVFRPGAILLAVLALAAVLFAGSPPAPQAPALAGILAGELARNFDALKRTADPPPYYAAYEIFDEETGAVSATLGALTGNGSAHSRHASVTIRVGNPKLDNYHRIAGESAQFTSLVALPVEDSPAALQRILWLETDRVYRTAAERLIKIRSNQRMNVDEEDDSPDFSKEDPQVHSEPVLRLFFPAEQAAERVKKLSAEFAKAPRVLASSVTLMGQRDTRYFVDTEGRNLVYGHGMATITVTGYAKAEDGMDLATSQDFEAEDVGALAKDAAVSAAIRRVSSDIEGMLAAPVAEPFSGPAILSGRASAVFFHEIFGHRVEGHRQKDEQEGQTFTKSVGKAVLPDFLSVVFDPSRRTFNGASLNGFYEYDDDGVKAESVTAVDKGILKTFLMSRSPIRGFDRSNGHGRRQMGYDVVSRQSNLFVESSRQVSETKLREMLLAEIERQNKPYGLYFREVTGGYTTMARQGVQAFKVMPVIVYRVYPDGRPDELVRGSDMVGTPLASFAKILATSDKPEVFNGYCGAESGNVPVSAVSPAILVSEIEIEKKEKSQDRPPLLAAPPEDAR